MRSSTCLTKTSRKTNKHRKMSRDGQQNTHKKIPRRNEKNPRRRCCLFFRDGRIDVMTKKSKQKPLSTRYCRLFRGFDKINGASRKGLTGGVRRFVIVCESDVPLAGRSKVRKKTKNEKNHNDANHSVVASPHPELDAKKNNHGGRE